MEDGLQKISYEHVLACSQPLSWWLPTTESAVYEISERFSWVLQVSVFRVVCIFLNGIKVAYILNMHSRLTR